jgi:hypothetical protein
MRRKMFNDMRGVVVVRVSDCCLMSNKYYYTSAPPEGGRYTVLPLSVRPSVCLSVRLSQDIFRRIFLSNY